MRVKRYLSYAAAAVLLLAAAPGFAAGADELEEQSSPASASRGQSGEPARISVGAEAELSAPPDIAHVTVGVRTSDPSLERASAANNERMRAVTEALRELEIAQRDLHTTGYSVSFREARDQRPRYEDEDERPGAYYVTNNLRGTVRDLDRLGEVIGTALEAGANQVSSVQFGLADREALAAEARREAMRLARLKAEELAEVEGLRLGRVLNIAEHDRDGVPPMLRSAEASTEAVPISPGEVTYRVQVSVSYELLPR